MKLSNINKIKNKLFISVNTSTRNETLYFEVNEKYSKYLCEELYDSFVVSLLPYAIKHEENIEVEGYISSKLYYQLNTYLIPLLCKSFDKKNIKIISKIKSINYNGVGVGASISCGVDSFYTLLKHINQEDKNYNITHLTFFNAGSNGEYGGEEARALFKKRVAYVSKFCAENNYELITIDTNINEFLMMNHEKTHTFRTLGCVLALQKLFSKYYFASGLPFDGSHIDESDTAFYDILNVQCFSNENITFYCSGLEATRLEKIKFISNYKETYNWLNVCTNEDVNCGVCEKCVRTMTALDSIGKLEKYENVFDISAFYKNKKNFMVKILEYNRDNLKHELYQEIINEYKKNKNPFTLITHLKSFRITTDKIKRMIPPKFKLKLKKKLKKGRNDGWCD